VWLDIAESRHDDVALSKALEALERVGSSPAATSEILTVYGRALLQNDQSDVAERVLQQAVERYPIDPAAFLVYSTAAERQNHFGAARDALVDYSALVADESDLVVRATRIAALSLRLNEPAVAADWLERAAPAVPRDVRLLASLADAQLKAGRTDAARETIARGLQTEPTNAALLALNRRAR
jgi:predicted Zn-dependent protease